MSAEAGHGASPAPERKTSEGPTFSQWQETLVNHAEHGLKRAKKPKIKVRPLGWRHSAIQGTFDPGTIFWMFGELRKKLVKEQGYSAKNIGGITYDWRGGPYEWLLDGSMTRTRETCEYYYELNGQRPVILATLSQASLFAQLFLSFMTEEWRKKYIRKWVTVGGPFGGAAEVTIGSIMPSLESYGCPNNKMECDMPLFTYS